MNANNGAIANYSCSKTGISGPGNGGGGKQQKKKKTKRSITHKAPSQASWGLVAQHRVRTHVCSLLPPEPGPPHVSITAAHMCFLFTPPGGQKGQASHEFTYSIKTRPRQFPPRPGHTLYSSNARNNSPTPKTTNPTWPGMQRLTSVSKPYSNLL